MKKLTIFTFLIFAKCSLANANNYCVYDYRYDLHCYKNSLEAKNIYNYCCRNKKGYKHYVK